LWRRRCLSYQLKIGVAECSKTWFVNYGLAVLWVEIGDDIMARLAADQKSAHGTVRSYAHSGEVVLRPKSLARRDGGKIGTMAWYYLSTRRGSRGEQGSCMLLPLTLTSIEDGKLGIPEGEEEAL
jgi:hypothetical protein